ncbi:MAG: bifunctional precorrin-2 dehydrogenase/sirohydrochlorin ferrochelatase [Bryobacterales bacterium]|nr:bifunctional precorrin-2 dehydrogenase/sirohydrochlorin ferrochelatase [Bryobacterales bacterium]
MPCYFPVFLNLEGRRCMVIGGSRLAAEKAFSLRACGARVTVAAEVLVDELAEAALLGQVAWIRRQYLPGDMDGFFLVVSAPDDRSINAAIFREAEQRGILFNALDDPPHCQFIFASVHRQGDLVLAISTAGVAPALAVRLRQRFGAELGPEYDAFLRLASEYRDDITTQIPAFPPRRDLWYRIVDSEIVNLLKVGRAEEARALLEQFLQEAGVQPQAAAATS